jgi:uncharacterized DUF497 family protein
MIIVWNPKKAESNLKKHGVHFEEAMTVLVSDVQLIIEDNSHDESRFVALGFSKALRLLVVVYCYRDENIIRIISARKATRTERKQYEERI